MKEYRGTIVILSLSLICLLPLSANAEIKTIETESSYIIGDNDSKIDARRIATQEAKRKALEQTGTYVESLTEVKDMALTKDEIRAYTAGIVETEIMSEEMKGTTDHPEIFIKVKCRIDTDILINKINDLRKDEDMKEQLDSALKENESLKKERENLLSKLSAEKDKTKAEDIRKKLGEVLSKEESTDEVNKLWRNLASRDIRDMNQTELNEAIASLKRFMKVNPENQRALTALLMIYKKRGDIAEAEKELKAAVATNPSNPLFHLKLGQLLKDEGKYKEAIKEFRIVDRLRPNKLDVLFNLGMTYYSMGDCKGGAHYLKRFLVFSKKNERTHPGMKSKAIKIVQECEDGIDDKKIIKRPLLKK